MKRLLLLLLVLLFSVLLGLQIANDPGYILIAYRHYVIETSIWVAAGAIVIFLGILSIGLRLFHSTQSLDKWLKEWPTRRRLAQQEEKAAKALKRLDYLNQLSQAENLEAVTRIWHTLPHRLHKQPEFIKAYAEKLVSYNETALAEKLVREFLKKNWDISLVRTYGLISSPHLDKQLHFAENLLKQHPQNPSLLLCLGRLCRYSQLWGKTRSYLETANSISPEPEIFYELAVLSEQLGDTQQAAKYYARGLKTAVNRVHFKT